MRTKKLNNKGFTLVEVIVVAVIVAVLALVAIQLYTGYVNSARKNTAENLAASAAGYLQSVYNSTGNDSLGDIDSGGSWSVTLSSGDSVTFVSPSNAIVDVVNDSVQAIIGGDTSSAHQWK